METVFAGVAGLKHDWRAWVVVALVCLKALQSLYLYFRCPVLCGRRQPSTEEIETARAYRFQAPASFLMLMLLGMALATGGLYLLGSAEHGPLGLGLLVLGVFIFSSEPNRLSVRGAMLEVTATTGASGDANYLARDNLRAAHAQRAAIEVAIAAASLAVLLFL